MASLEERIKRIEQRNRSVESDKAWETSVSRRVLIVLFTYLAIGLYLFAINVQPWWLHAIVPTAGFLLSTLTLPFFRERWIGSRESKN